MFKIFFCKSECLWLFSCSNTLRVFLEYFEHKAVWKYAIDNNK